MSVGVLMRICSGTGVYEAGKENITVYSLQQTRLHHFVQCSIAESRVNLQTPSLFYFTL